MQSELRRKNEALLSGTIVYFIGNILTQLISIFLLKYITGAVSAEEYGYFNLVVTIDNLVTPMITLQISDAVFRFMIKAESESEKKYIYSSCTAIILIGAAAVCILITFFHKYFGMSHAFWVALYVISTNLFGYNQKIVRSLGKNKLYVAANLFKACLYFVFMAVFVLKFRMGAKGLFISNCISTYLCVIYLFFRVKTYTYFDFRHISAGHIKEMLKFSAPLIPNTAIWWMQSSVNSVIIITQLGLAYNGIYSVSVKFASVLHLVINVFNLAWQESAVTEYGSEGYKGFITQTFRRYLVFLISGVAVLIPLLRLFMPYLIDQSYYEAIPYIPFLLFSTALSACSGFFAQIITAKNRNIKLLTTNIVGAAANILIVFLFIRHIGIWAIVLSAVVSNVVLSACRYREVKEDFDRGGINRLQIALLLAMSLLSCAAFFANSNMVTVTAFIVMLLLGIYMNFHLVKEIFSVMKKKGKP